MGAIRYFLAILIFGPILFSNAALAKDAVAHYYCLENQFKMEIRTDIGGFAQEAYPVTEENCVVLRRSLNYYKGRIDRITKVAFCTDEKEMQILYLRPTPSITEGPLVPYDTQEKCLLQADEINKIP